MTPRLLAVACLGLWVGDPVDFRWTPIAPTSVNQTCALRGRCQEGHLECPKALRFGRARTIHQSADGATLRHGPPTCGQFSVRSSPVRLLMFAAPRLNRFEPALRICTSNRRAVQSEYPHGNSALCPPARSGRTTGSSCALVRVLQLLPGPQVASRHAGNGSQDCRSRVGRARTAGLGDYFLILKETIRSLP